MDFVAAKNLGVGNDDKLRGFADKTASQRTDVENRLGRRIRSEAIFRPDLSETLALAFVVADNVHLVALPKPAMQLIEELAALRFGDLDFRRAIHLRTERFEAPEE